MLKTALKYKCSLKSNLSSFKKGYSYFSNNKFCSYSNKLKIRHYSIKIKEVLQLAENLNLNFNLLTLTSKNFKPKNEEDLNSFIKNLNLIQNRFFNTLLSKQNLFDFENFMKKEKSIILKKLQSGKIDKFSYNKILDDINYRFPQFIEKYLKLISLKNKIKHKRYGFLTKEIYKYQILELEKNCLISKIIKGYLGTLETTISKNGAFHIHKHLLILQKDFISQYYCKFLFSQVCKRYGKFEELKNSFILQFSKTPIYFKVQSEDNKKRLSRISNYVFKYITKGNHFKNKNYTQMWIKATAGIRLISSGGLLSQRNLKNYISLKYVDLLVNQSIFFDIDTINFDYENSFFKKDFFINENLKSDIQKFLKLGYSQKQIRNKISFNKFDLELNHFDLEKIPQYQTYFFKHFKEFIFSKNEKTCPLTSSKLLFKKVEKKSRDTSLLDFFDLTDCLISCSDFYHNEFLLKNSHYFSNVEVLKISKKFKDNADLILKKNLGVDYTSFIYETQKQNEIYFNDLQNINNFQTQNLIFNQYLKGEI